ncbi:Serine/threonine-protein kinase [Rhizina undulata]
MVTAFTFFRGGGNSSPATPSPGTPLSTSHVTTHSSSTVPSTPSAGHSPITSNPPDFFAAAGSRRQSPILRTASATACSTTSGNGTTTATSHSNAVASPRPQLPLNTVAAAVNSSATDMLRAVAGQSLRIIPFCEPKRQANSPESDDSRSDEDDPLNGQTTPHPNGLDKRLPGIIHGFHQVCSKFVTFYSRATPETSAEEDFKHEAPASPSKISSTSKLTETISSEKDTPPATPRGTASTGSTLDGSTASTNASSANSNTTPAAPVGPPKGKLVVKILEARNIRPSKDPYVVCTFESNEFISKGPKKSDDVEVGSPSGENSCSDNSGAPGRSIAIPMKSRQSSSTSLSELQGGKQTNPKWEREAVFDALGERSEIDVSIYDRSNHERFLGHIRICPLFTREQNTLDSWFPLHSRGPHENVTGEIHLQISFEKTTKKHYGPEDFQLLRLIGKGTFGQVYQVRKKDTGRIYAMKVLSKKVIVQKKEVAHTLGERNILVRTATSDSPFIVGLKFSFQTPTDLYLVTDYMSGGELFWHLQKEGRFKEDRAKFYIAELILALEHLHNHDIVYRDLKPENILLDANGHIALCDFGLSKANLAQNATTNTFCGTTEYLAPEVLLDETGYTKMVDFWSLGVLVFEMCCGWSPFYAEDTQQMYKNIAFGKVRFPRDALSIEGRNFVKGLLNRNPKHRLGATHDAKELKSHPFFNDVDWNELLRKNVIPPFKPTLSSETDTSNFDPEFTNAPMSGSLNARAAAAAAGNFAASTPLSPGMQANFRGFTFVDESSMDDHFGGRDELEKMDEDSEDNWADAFVRRKREGEEGRGFDGRGNRMSGIVKTGLGDDEGGIFNNGGMDI